MLSALSSSAFTDLYLRQHGLYVSCPLPFIRLSFTIKHFSKGGLEGILCLSSMVSKKHFRVFWDYESCKTQRILPTVENLRTMLSEKGFIDCIQVYLDIATLDREERILFQLAGVSVIDAPTHQSSDDRRDGSIQHVMNTDLLLHALLAGTASSGAVVVSAHPSFAYPVSMLKLKGYDCIVVSPSTSHLAGLWDFLDSTVIDWNACNALCKQRKEPHQRRGYTGIGKPGGRPDYGTDESASMESRSPDRLLFPSFLPSSSTMTSNLGNCSSRMAQMGLFSGPFRSPRYDWAEPDHYYHSSSDSSSDSSTESDSSSGSVYRHHATLPTQIYSNSYPSTTPRTGPTLAPYSATRSHTPAIWTVSNPMSVQQMSSPLSDASDSTISSQQPETVVHPTIPVPIPFPMFSFVQEYPLRSPVTPPVQILSPQKLSPGPSPLPSPATPKALAVIEPEPLFLVQPLSDSRLSSPVPANPVPTAVQPSAVQPASTTASTSATAQAQREVPGHEATSGDV